METESQIERKKAILYTVGRKEEGNVRDQEMRGGVL